MIVIDTSAWIEWLRNSGHPVTATVTQLLRRREDIAITEAVLMEVLAGAPPGKAMTLVRSQLIALPILRLEGVGDFEEAAAIYRACRDGGHTLRNQVDCLIAVPTIRNGASLLHNDRDFEKIAQHTTLKLHPVEHPRSSDGEPQMRERKAGWRRKRVRARASA